MTGPVGEISGCHQYSPGFSGPVGFPVGLPLVWKEGRFMEKELARRAMKRVPINEGVFMTK
jgi:hypothetical protein